MTSAEVSHALIENEKRGSLDRVAVLATEVGGFDIAGWWDGFPCSGTWISRDGGVR